MSRESAISAIERGALSELCHVLEESELDIRSEPLDSEGQSALHIACTSGHLDIVRYLLVEKQCSMTVEYGNGHTPLLLSLIHKHWKIADFLLQNTPTSTLKEQLHAVQRFSESTVAEVAKEALLESLRKGYFALLGFIIILYPEVGEAIIAHHEVEKSRSSGALYQVQWLLKGLKCKIPDNMPDIHVACIVGDMEKVKSALDSNGQSILGTTDRYGTAAIHYAAYEPNILCMIVGLVSNNGEFDVLNLSDKKGNTVLHHCVMSGCVDSVEHVIRVPECNVNQLNDEKEAPLHVACKLKNTAAIQLLAANERCDLSIRDKKGDTALHIAAYTESNGIEMVKCLLRSGKCDLNQVNSEHETPLHVACKHRHVGVVEILVADERCDPFVQDIKGDTALYAVLCNKVYKDNMIVQILLRGCMYDLTNKDIRCTNELNFISDLGIKPLLKLCDYRVIIKDAVLTLRKGASMNTVKILLHHIANCNSLSSNSLLLRIPNSLQCEHTLYTTVSLKVEMKTNKGSKWNKTLLVEYEGVDGSLSYNSDQETLLHAVCRSGYPVMTVALLKNGADPQAVDKDGNTVVHTACHNLQFNCLRLLGEYHNQNRDGDTIFHILCRMKISKEKLPECVKFLRETKELDMNTLNGKGDAPLHIACRWSYGDVVGTLVEMDCDVNACDWLGKTALHIAISSEIDRLQKVHCVLESGKCNPNVRNKCGHAPLHTACRERNIELLEMFVTDQRCDVNIKDNNANTPLHTAIHAHSGLRWRKVQLLLSNSACDLKRLDKDGSTCTNSYCL